MIIAIHVYHMLAFKMSSDDLFHHLTFVPVIGGGHFVWPWGAAGNILCFFISGFPGGIDYALLAMVKRGWVSSMTEKRINLSINVWIGPRHYNFASWPTSWLQSSEWLGEGAEGDSASMGFRSSPLLVFNGQYHGMLVIGNYYIRITENAFSTVTKGGRTGQLSMAVDNAVARGLETWTPLQPFVGRIFCAELSIKFKRR